MSNSNSFQTDQYVKWNWGNGEGKGQINCGTAFTSEQNPVSIRYFGLAVTRTEIYHT